MTLKRIGSFRLVDHGVENAQYFSGHGIALSTWDDCATGIGDTAQHALTDALEQLACRGWEVEHFDTSVAFLTEAGRLSNLRLEEVDGANDESSDLQYYVSIDVREVTK